MIWQPIETHIDFNDPVSGFEFRRTITIGGEFELYFHDWRNRLIQFYFKSVSHFHFAYLCPLPNFPGFDFYSIENSSLIALGGSADRWLTLPSLAEHSYGSNWCSSSAKCL